MSKAIGLLGGTFDPVHLGHLALAAEVYKQFDLQEIRFIPCHQSPFKEHPIATDRQRLAMLKLALKNHPKFTIDDRELRRKNISYTVDTLKSIHQETNTHLYLIMSMDAFSQFNKWHKWREIIQLADLIVGNRPGSRPITHDELKKLSIHIINIPPNSISATEIRQLIKTGQEASSLVPKLVWEYIVKNKLYQGK
jgi:nicotinate-nucleotide adenylyltransferase